MSNKGWQHIFVVKRHPRTLRLGYQLVYSRWMLGWPNLTIIIFFWRKTYRLRLYKMGED